MSVSRRSGSRADASRGAAPRPQASTGGRRGRAAAAGRRPVRGEGQHRRRRPADHRRLPGLRLPRRTRPRPWSSGCSTPARCCIGKTNLDQFATGLVGARSPLRRAAAPSTTATTSAAGRAPARRWRSPPAWSPSRWAPTRPAPAACRRRSTASSASSRPRGAGARAGVVPACRSLDCVTVFTPTAEDAALVDEVAAGFDPADTYSRRAPAEAGVPYSRRAGRFRLRRSPPPEQLNFFGDSQSAAPVRGRRCAWRPWAAERSRSTSRRCSQPRACSTRGPGSPSAPPRSRPCCASSPPHPSGRARHPAGRTRAHRRRRLPGRIRAAGAPARGRGAVGGRSTSCSCPRRPPPTASARCWPSRWR